MSDIHFDAPRSTSRRGEHIAFRMLVVLTFPLFFAAALMSRLVSFPAPSGARGSVFAQARGASEAAIAFAFQG